MFFILDDAILTIYSGEYISKESYPIERYEAGKIIVEGGLFKSENENDPSIIVYQVDNLETGLETVKEFISSFGSLEEYRIETEEDSYTYNEVDYIDYYIYVYPIKKYNISITNNMADNIIENIIENKDYIIDTTPKLGYQLKKLLVNNIDVSKKVVDDKYEIKDIKEDINIEIEFQPIQYKFIEGMNSVYSDKNLVFRCDGPIQLLDKVYLNDIELDSKNYILTEGSTIISINSKYLSSIKNGTYNLKLTYKNDTSAETQFIIPKVENVIPPIEEPEKVISIEESPKVEEVKQEISNPQTYDDITTWITLLIVSLIGIVSCLIINIYVNKKDFV